MCSRLGKGMPRYHQRPEWPWDGILRREWDIRAASLQENREEDEASRSIFLKRLLLSIARVLQGGHA